MITNSQLIDIADLDLDPIKVKLMHKSGEGWSLEKANVVEGEYRRFLHLMKLYPNELTAPLNDVDIFWHYHILDTMKYAADCEAVFGYFLHHFPYVGLRGEEDEAAMVQCANRMRELYEATFNEPYLRAPAAYCTRTLQANSSYCTRALEDASAYCTRAAPQAASADCTRAAETVPAAYCTRGAEAAYCTSAVRDTLARAMHPSPAAQALARFVTERPTLPVA